MNAIDLYSGIGGWTLGMKLSGIENISSFEWWDEANFTHNVNFSTKHLERDIRNIDCKKDLKYQDKIDFVVGSPPCTQFSFSNRGGNGDIKDGLQDIFKFLQVVDFIKPKYWAMENVPRVAKILETELKGGSLSKFRHLVKVIKIVDCSEYGVPQSRKRMIAGNFPFDLFDSYKRKIKPKTLGDVIHALESESIITDPNYGYRLKKAFVSELENEADLSNEEIRINRDSKVYHPVYNSMSFPDNLNRPSRTITATCTRVSRESIIINSKTGYRRLNVRERGVIQGFPITFQFYGKTLGSKFKMIGNAVPPILTYYLFQSMLEVKLENVLPPSKSKYRHYIPDLKPISSKLSAPNPKYPPSRKFQFAIPNLRFGSGVRFELSNVGSSSNDWKFRFVYGNSKSIKEINLYNDLSQQIKHKLNTSDIKIIASHISNIRKRHKKITSKSIQALWTNPRESIQVFHFIDDIGDYFLKMISVIDVEKISDDFIAEIFSEKNKKLIENKAALILGLYFLSELNKKIF